MTRPRSTALAAAGQAWCAILVAAGLCWPAMAPAADPAPIPLTATIRNDPAGEPLRCVMVMAHFVTVDLEAIAPGEEISIALARDAGTRTLIVTAADGRQMVLETVLCGATSAWAETRSAVPLMPLRETADRRILYTCRIGRRLSCEAK